MLKRFFELRSEIGQFIKEKGKPVAELDDPEWDCDLFLCLWTKKDAKMLRFKSARKSLVNTTNALTVFVTSVEKNM